MRLIDADAFKAYMRGALEQTRRCYPDGGEWAEAVTEEFCRDIDEQPTIQPERKQGEWINEGRIIRCSKCKIGYAVVKGMKSAITYNFCPSCGSDMREVQ